MKDCPICGTSNVDFAVTCDCLYDFKLGTVLGTMAGKKAVIVKTYTGSQTGAAALFQRDAELMAAQGYHPISQSWAPGSYGCLSFLIALLFAVILVGIVIFVYMLFVKPNGTLSVTYELRAMPPAQTPTPEPAAEKICPKCAEPVKAAAQVCRFCGHTFV